MSGKPDIFLAIYENFTEIPWGFSHMNEKMGNDEQIQEGYT